PVLHNVRGRISCFKSCRIDEWLEAGTGLTLGLNGAVEFAIHRGVPSADHGTHGTVSRHDDDRSLGLAVIFDLLVEDPLYGSLGHSLYLLIKGGLETDIFGCFRSQESRSAVHHPICEITPGAICCCLRQGCRMRLRFLQLLVIQIALI